MDDAALILSALGLGYDAYKGNQPPKGLAGLNASAQQFGKMGTTLTAAGMGGPLPPGARALQASQNDAGMAGIRSQFAQMGLSGSTMEAQAIAGQQQQSAALGYQMTEKLLSDGMKATGLSADLLDVVMKANLAQDDGFMKAVGNFASALAGGT